MQSRHDPRVEPDDPPSADDVVSHPGSRSHGSKPESAKRVSVPPARPSFDPRVDPTGLGETSDLVELPVEPPSRPRPTAPQPPTHQRPARAETPPSRQGSQTGSRASLEAPSPSRRASGSHVTNVDPRLEQIEPIIDEGNWHTVGKQLGSLEDSGRLPPTLGLVAAVAHSEIAGEAGCPEANELAIRCMAGVFGLGDESAISRVLAKRLLRRNQRVAPTRPSMAASLAFVLIAIFLAVGLVGGYLIGSGTLKLPH